MAEPYPGEIRPFHGVEPPPGWTWCDGQRLPIAEYPELYLVLGQRFGGEGDHTFAVPALRGSAVPGGISDRAAKQLRCRQGITPAAVSPAAVAPATQLPTSPPVDGARLRFIIAVGIGQLPNG